MIKQKTLSGLLVALMFMVVAIFFVFPVIAHAQNSIVEGTQLVGEATVLGAEDPRIIVGRVIRIFLGFLGVVTIAVILYGGFLYMISGGSEAGVDKAKQWIINGVIGLAIILSAFALTSFIINRLSEATGSGQQSTPIDNAGGSGGTGVVFSVSISPRGNDRPITSLVKVTYPFGRVPLSDNDYQNAKDNIKVYKLVDGEEQAVAGQISVLNRIITFTPDTVCPEGCNKPNCFDSVSSYIVKVLNLQDQTGETINCASQLEGYCQSSAFTTSSFCDTDNPEVSINSLSPSPVQQNFDIAADVSANDVGGLQSVELCPTKQTDLADSCQLFSLSGDSQSEYLSIINSQTTGFELGWHTSTFSALDLSDNSGQTTKRFLVASSSCFNDANDFDCTLPDCEVDQCPACTNPEGCDYVCQEGINCTELNGVTTCETSCQLWPYPVIESVLPASGPVGSFVTLRGKNFRSFSDQSQITFNGQEAQLACGRTGSWLDTQVVVRVPENGNGPIILTDKNGNYNNTSDLESPGWKGNYSINADNSNWIGLCSVVNQQSNLPSGEVTSLANAVGENFGSTGEVYFNQFTTSEVSRTNTTITGIRIPNLAPGNVPVQVGRDNFPGLYSNPVNFRVEKSADALEIISISQNPAPSGQLITIEGKNFGSSGTVNFLSGTDSFLADSVCQNFWSDNQLKIKIPEQLDNGSFVLQVSGVKGVDSKDFVVNNDLPVSPGICSLSPNNGSPGTKINIVGTGFGNSPAQIKFFKSDGVYEIVEGFALTDVEWTDASIEGVVVPALAKTGNVYVSRNGADSNPAQFTVGRCSAGSCGAGQVCCNDNYCSLTSECQAEVTSCEYGWYFSTGRIPRVPKIIERTCSAGEYNESPSPTKNSGSACPNSVIAFSFNMEMAPSSFLEEGNQIEVRKCILPGVQCNLDTCEADRCESSTYSFSVRGVVEGEPDIYELSNSNFEGEEITEVSLKNYGTLGADFWYQVKVPAGLSSSPLNGEVQQMSNDYVWRFHTGSQDCSINSVVVNPSDGVLDSIADTQKYVVNGQGQNCSIINVSLYDWSWSIESKYLGLIERLSSAGLNGDEALFGLLSGVTNPETPANDPVDITASAVLSSNTVSDSANLSVQLLDPKVIDFWPNCDQACRNAELGAEFNTFIKKESLFNNNTNISLYRCNDQNCLSVVGQDNLLSNNSASPEILCDSTTGETTIAGTNVCNRLTVSPNTALEPSVYYRLVIKDNILSISNKNLTGLNFNTQAEIGTCGNGVLEADAGEQCEAICKNTAGNSCDFGADGCVCSLGNNPVCSNDCRLVGFPDCDNSEFGACCGNGVLETYPTLSLSEQCEATNCSKVDRVIFTGSQALSTCNQYLDTTTDDIISTACSCSDPKTCDSPVCASYCKENISQTCTQDSLNCTCIEPKVCTQDTTKFCSADAPACTCQAQKACQLADGSIGLACTTSSVGCNCLEVGTFEKMPTEQCFSPDPVKGNCIKVAHCAENPAQVCTGNISACTCSPITSIPNYSCPSERQICQTECSISKRSTCTAGDPDCICSFPSGCSSCVTQTESTDQITAFDAYSFVFKVRDGEAYCRPDRVDVNPGQYTSVRAGDEIVYSASSYGAPDICSAAGQRLNPYDYNWRWDEFSNPTKAINLNSSVSYDANNPAHRKLISIFESIYLQQINPGCTENCLNLGSEPYQAVCGNSLVEVGEECDDGNVNNNDGCTDICLYSGTTACFGDSVLDSGAICCGNGTINFSEDCDDGNNASGDGCSAVCLNEGSTASGFTCGNSLKELGEDDDFGQLNQKFGLNNKCLYSGSNIKSSDRVAICGNGTIESGEECEPISVNCLDSNGSTCNPTRDSRCSCEQYSDAICSNTCLLSGFPACDQSTTRNCCGNGLGETYDGYEEECEYICQDAGKSCSYGSAGCSCIAPSWCTSECLNNGSAIIAGTSCNDGSVDPGEDYQCEGDDSGASFGSPKSLITVLGYLSIATSEETAMVRATLTENVTAEEKTAGATGISLQDSGELKYIYSGQAGPTPPGCDPNNPPRATMVSPDLANPVCRNSAIFVSYDLLLDDLLTGTSTASSHVEIEYQAENCTTGSLSFIGQIKDWFRKIFISSASALDWCKLDKGQYQITIRPISDKTQTSIFIQPNEILKSTRYKIILKDLKNNCRMSIPKQEFTFDVSTDICHFDSVGVDPAEKYATTVNETWSVHRFAKAGSNILFSTADYSWTWDNWRIDDGGLNIVSITNPAPDEFEASAGTQNGTATITAKAHIARDQFYGESGRTIEGSGIVTTFLCENPQTLDFPFDNLQMPYCRDAGQSNVLDDDLPAISVIPAGQAANEQNLLHQYFLLRQADITNDFSSDAISLRVYSNPGNLSARDWYLTNVPNAKTVVTEIKVDCATDPLYQTEICYYGVQDGNTIYISGGNKASVETQGTINRRLFNNIYVLGYNQQASPNTINIFSQLVDNISLNTNVSTSDELWAIKRDIKRVNDIVSIRQLLSSYYTQHSTLPKLESGTYLRSNVYSPWPSWQAEFANVLGRALSVDPVNSFASYEPSSLPEYNGVSCDNTNNGRKCFTSSDSCFTVNNQSICSLCRTGTDPKTCFNSETQEYQSNSFRSSHPFSGRDYVYWYTFNSFNSAQLDYKLEGILKGYYDSFSNNPDINISF